MGYNTDNDDREHLCTHVNHIIKKWLCNKEDLQWGLRTKFSTIPVTEKISPDLSSSSKDASNTGMAVATFVHGVDTHAPLAYEVSHVTFTHHTTYHNASEPYSSELPDQHTTDATILHQYAVMDVIIVFAVIIITALSIIFISVYVGKLRKRENASVDDEESGGGGGASKSENPNAVVVLDTANSDCPVADFEISEKRRGIWQKTVHSVMLRLKGQEQHKDVYVMPDALREQLKQVYVY